MKILSWELSPESNWLVWQVFFRLEEEKTRHRGCIWGVYDKPAFRRQGMARAWLSAIIKHVRSQKGLEQITVAVSSQRSAAKALYLSLGFKSYRFEPQALKVGDIYVDEEWMALKNVGPTLMSANFARL